MRNNHTIYKEINQLSSREKKWFAVYTKHKCEKYIVDNLQKKGITCYVPLVNEIKQYTRKTVKVSKPLINCYVFVKILKEEYIKVLQTDYVKAFLKINTDLLAIPEKEIDLLKRIVGEAQKVDVNYDLAEGQEVEVIAGNLTGLKGKLVSKNGNHSFLVELETIGFQLIMEIDKSSLRPRHLLQLN